jgi:hypothetical protein
MNAPSEYEERDSTYLQAIETSLQKKEKPMQNDRHQPESNAGSSKSIRTTRRCGCKKLEGLLSLIHDH